MTATLLVIAAGLALLVYLMQAYTCALANTFGVKTDDNEN